MKKLAAANAIRKGHNPSNYTKFAFLNARNEWRQNPPGGIPNHVRGQVKDCLKKSSGLMVVYRRLRQTLPLP